MKEKSTFKNGDENQSPKPWQNLLHLLFLPVSSTLILALNIVVVLIDITSFGVYHIKISIIQKN